MQYLLALIIGVVILFAAAGFMASAQSERIRAEANAQATIIRAESQARIARIEAENTARIARAEADAIRTRSFMPVALCTIGGFTLAVVVTAFCLAASSYFNNRPMTHVRTVETVRIIEKRVVMVLPEGSPRRDMWQMLSSGDPEALIIEGRRDHET